MVLNHKSLNLSAPRFKVLRRSLLGGLLALGLLYLAGYFLTGARMPANATIAGIDVAGMSPSAARSTLDKKLAPKLDDPITMDHKSISVDFSPRDIGLSVDLERSVDQAGGQRSWNPGTMFGLLFGENDHAPAIDVDRSKMKDALDSLGEAINNDVIEAQITFNDDKPVQRPPRAGLVVDRDATVNAIGDAYLVTKEPVEVPTNVVRPAVDAAGLAKAMDEFAKPAVSAPVRLSVGTKTVPLPPSAYSPALIVRVEDGELKPWIDPRKLAKPLTDSTTGIGKKAVDATVRIEGDKPVVVPSKMGIGLQPKELAKTLIPVLTKTGDDRELEIETKAVEPETTTDEVKKLGIKTKVGSFTTNYPPAEYRDINQSRAAELINGTIVKPGETFSFNDTVGERTTANGFVVGTVINGGVFREEQGGGVSQVVTTTYNAAFFAGLTDVEHHPHDLYISRYPVGREATVYWGNLDLKFRNDTKYGVLVRAYVKKAAGRPQGATTVEMWSTKVYDIKAGLSDKRRIRKPVLRYDPTDKCVAQSPSKGFDVDVFRYFYQNGKKVKTETDTARYRATDEVRCEERPKKED
ncbi:MAG: VanW family protein [Aeromicrobium sp.]